MHKNIIKNLLLLFSLLLTGAVGANIIPNGDLSYTINGKPAFWVLEKGASYDAKACEGKPALILTNDGQARQFASFRIIPKPEELFQF